MHKFSFDGTTVINVFSCNDKRIASNVIGTTRNNLSFIILTFMLYVVVHALVGFVKSEN